jgi:hypothetical protein
MRLVDRLRGYGDEYRTASSDLCCIPADTGFLFQSSLHGHFSAFAILPQYPTVLEFL